MKCNAAMAGDIPICECATFWETHHDECPVRREVESLRATISRLREDAERMKTALKVIETWARFDAEPRSGYSVAALHPQRVIELCGKAIDAAMAGGE